MIKPKPERTFTTHLDSIACTDHVNVALNRSKFVAYDVNQDGEITALDALLVINWLNTHANTLNKLGEGEAPAFTYAADEINATPGDERARRKRATGSSALVAQSNGSRA